MHPLHADEEVAPPPLTYAALERRLARERSARKAAEDLLEKKSQELYQANQELRSITEVIERERTMLQAVFDARPSGLIVTTANLEIIRMNPTARALSGQDARVGTRLYLTNIIAASPEIWTQICNCECNGQETAERPIEARVRHLDGEEIPVRLSCANIGHDDLRLWILLDLRGEIESDAQRKLLEQNLAQAQKLEALGTLASGVAHEINTPIQYIGDNTRFLKDVLHGLSEMLATYDRALTTSESAAGLQALRDEIAVKKQDLDLEFLLEEAPLAFDHALHGLDQVASIVRAIREFSHPGESEFAPVDLNSIIETTLSVSRNAWKQHARIEQNLAADLPTIPGIPGDLHQMMLNLVSNATDAIAERNPAGGGVIGITTRLIGGEVEIAISDNGCGIDPEHHSRVFDPFFTTKPPGKGTGQGLAIVYRIVQSTHNGRLTLESKPGAGTTFRLRFPVSETA
ncbi:hypothetical protein GCM10011316_33150 [Roseibium aquae]|uniref:histidine kinase n=1 Tax=Roseibium aquae TaxID=1323746 RepID=A0A916TN76_9HYPH|nr:ATP-binding protein [Roseibium aquae]GGB58447.1 hypothetical protein GCM10011316_33150 [Roseibium aquae]